jgi:DNA replication initiation complex subunit (GINS family)
MAKINMIAEKIAQLTDDQRDAIMSVINLLSAEMQTIDEDDEAPIVNTPSRTAKPSRNEIAKPAKPTKPAKPSRDEKPAKPAKPAAVEASEMSGKEFCEKYGVTHTKKNADALMQEIDAKVADKKDSAYYTTKANKAKLSIVLGRGKPSEMTRKRAAIIALLNAGKL